MIAREIKELSFAMEALSRIADASNEYESVKILLRAKIDALQLDAYPAFVVPPPAPNLDDDIPF
jgi:hypothetical protein